MRCLRFALLACLGASPSWAAPEATVRQSADRLCELYVKAAGKDPRDVAAQEAAIGKELSEALRLPPAARALRWHPDFLRRFSEISREAPSARTASLVRYVTAETKAEWSCPAMVAYDQAMAAVLDKKRTRFKLAERAKFWSASELRCPSGDQNSGAGTLEASAVTAVVAAHAAAIRACHERWLPSGAILEKGLDLGGQVEVLVMLEPSGRVSSARVEQSTLKSMEVESCVLTEVCSFELPPFAGEPVELIVPFSFAARGAADAPTAVP